LLAPGGQLVRVVQRNGEMGARPIMGTEDDRASVRTRTLPPSPEALHASVRRLQARTEALGARTRALETSSERLRAATNRLREKTSRLEQEVERPSDFPPPSDDED
jgi:predicted RNase H-like nuclease (RuvC/YqgF family)